MKNSKHDVQREFELLYERISEIKLHLEASLIYDSSGQTSECESCPDDELLSSDTSSEITKPDDKASTHTSQTEEPVGKYSTDNEFKYLDTVENLEGKYAVAVSSSKQQQDPNSCKDSISFNTKVLDTNTVELNDKDQASENKIYDNKDTSHQGHDMLKVTDDTDDTIVNLRCKEIDASFPETDMKAEIQNTNKHRTDQEHLNKYDKHRRPDKESYINQKRFKRDASGHNPTWTRSFMFNIRPRRRLHESNFAGSKEDIDTYCPNDARCLREDTETETIIKDMGPEVTDNLLASMTVDEIIETDADDNKCLSSQDSHETENFNYLTVEGEFISFCTKSLDSYSDSSSDETFSTAFEPTLQFLDFRDGLVTFSIKSEDYNVDLAKPYSEYSDSEAYEDVFSDDGTYGIESLFNTTGMDSDNITVELNEEPENLADESLEAIAQLYDQDNYSDREVQDRKRKVDASEETESVTGGNGIVGSKILDEVALVNHEDGHTLDQHLSARKTPNHMEQKSQTIQCQFAGVVLLNALPRIVTSSLFSNLFSNPTYSFTFYQPIPLRNWSRLSSSDFAKLSFSSQELPFKNLAELTCRDVGSHFETLSTSSKESSLESVCEG